MVVIDNYRVSSGAMCGLAQICDQCYFHNRIVDEPLCFGLARALGFRYYRQTDWLQLRVSGSTSNAYTAPIYGTAPGWMDRLQAALGFRWQIHQGSIAEESWQEVRARLDNGVPIYVPVDKYYLNFDGAHGIRHTVEHQGITILGYDDSGARLLVADTVPFFHDFVPLDEFFAAWGSQQLPPQNRLRWSEFQLTDRIPDYGSDIVPASLESFNNLRGIEENAGDREFVSGVRAIETLATDLQVAGSAIDQGEWEGFCRNLHYIIARTDGPVISWRLFAQYLMQYNSDSLNSFGFAGESFAQFASRWYVIANMALKSGMSGNRTLFSRAVSQIVSLADDMRNLLRQESPRVIA
jgi:hypothetical protein